MTLRISIASSQVYPSGNRLHEPDAKRPQRAMLVALLLLLQLAAIGAWPPASSLPPHPHISDFTDPQTGLNPFVHLREGTPAPRARVPITVQPPFRRRPPILDPTEGDVHAARPSWYRVLPGPSEPALPGRGDNVPGQPEDPEKPQRPRPPFQKIPEGNPETGSRPSNPNRVHFYPKHPGVLAGRPARPKPSWTSVPEATKETVASWGNDNEDDDQDDNTVPSEASLSQSTIWTLAVCVAISGASVVFFACLLVACRYRQHQKRFLTPSHRVLQEMIQATTTTMQPIRPFGPKRNPSE